MTMIYRTNDGKTIAAENASELIRALHETSRQPAASHQEFMRETAMRIGMTMPGVEIDCATPEKFVAGLVHVGILTEEEDAS
jgi:hypothetical protein